MSAAPSRTVRVARWSATHPTRAVGLWLLFVGVAIAIGPIVGLHAASDDDGFHGQSAAARHWARDAGLVAPDTEDVLITSTSGPLSGPAASAAAATISAKMRALPQVTSVAGPTTSPDGSAVLVEMTLRAGTTDVSPLLAATSSVDAPGLRVEEVGDQSFDKAVSDQVSSDLSKAARLSLPVTLLILVVAFGAVVAAGVPVLLALSSVGAAIGLSSLVSLLIPSSDSVSSLILLMGMAVGVDYSLFYVSRFRAELRAGRAKLDAVEIAAETSGHSVLISGVAVMVSMGGLFLATDLTFASLAGASILVVAIAVVGSLTVLPALLALLGARIDTLRVPLLNRFSRRTHGEPRIWNAILRPVLAHPGRSLAVSVVALGMLALPAFGLRLAADSAASLPSSIAETHSLARLTAAFPGQHTSDEVVVRAPAASASAVTSGLQGLATGPGFVAGSAVVAGSTDGAVHVLRVDVPYDPESAAARNGVEQLRRSAATTFAVVSGAHAVVGGEVAEDLDTDAHLQARLPWVIGGVVLVTMLVMALVFGSFGIALLTAGANLLSAGAAFGVLTLVFQHHWMDGVLGYRSTGAVINWIPLFTFGVLFGLSMDYHVFALSRVRESIRSGLPLREAVGDGITRSAGVVTSAAVVMVSVFVIFAGLHMVEMKELGLGLAVAVLVDAVVVRLVVLPSALCLLGRWAWWPGTRGATQRGRDSDDVVHTGASGRHALHALDGCQVE